eukprot:TRINITY_DN5677_c1_g1_i1.p1 TRINITY_DN5677_c1_g1~~TRINITY_DN5677_c1_g1_i1.p1  ORF type:complete len:227 (+),score=37.30 TRINITY_DN5677_c1_g1_i1:77-757(+)
MFSDQATLRCLHCSKDYPGSQYESHLRKVGFGKVADLIFTIDANDEPTHEGDWVQRNTMLRDIIERDASSGHNLQMRNAVHIHRSVALPRQNNLLSSKPGTVPSWVIDEQVADLTDYSRFTDVADRIWYGDIGGGATDKVTTEPPTFCSVLNTISKDVIVDPVMPSYETSSALGSIAAIRELFSKQGADSRDLVTALTAASSVLPPKAARSVHPDLPAIEAELQVE